jgi:hypothetical protein
MKAITPDFVIAAIAASLLTNCYHHRLPQQEAPRAVEFRTDVQTVGLRRHAEETPQLPPLRSERRDVVMPYLHRIPTKQERLATIILATNNCSPR